MKLKRVISFFLLMVLLCSNCVTVSAQQYEIRAPHMYAHSYAVMDANTGEILFGENVDKKIYPASTAKLMSAIVAVESGIPLDTVIEMERSIVKYTTLGTYDIGLNGGEHFSLSTLLNLSLIASAADATDMMAVAISGSKEAFVEKMMEKVEELGLTHTSFDNPVGSDIGGGFDNTYSTAREMCEITRYAMANPVIRKIVAKHNYIVPGDGKITGKKVTNTNYFYNQYPYNRDAFTIIGSKTGQTTAAGNVFIATAIDDEGHELICAYFGRSTKKETFRWIDNLLTYAFKNYKEGNLSLTKGAYNVRYHESSLPLIRSIDGDILHQEDDGRIDLLRTITEEEAVSMIAASFGPEIKETSLPFYFDSLTGSEDPCTKEFLVEAFQKALPGIQGIGPISRSLSELSGELSLTDAAAVFTTATKCFDLYEMSYPSLKIRTWSMEDPVPFMTEPKLPIGFLEER